MTQNNLDGDSLAREIEKALADPAGSFFWAVGPALDELHAAGHSIPAHERFLQLCAAAGLAFPKPASNLTDAEILASPATPELMRYLLRVLANYAARAYAASDSGQQMEPRDRQTAIANALGLTGNHGGGHNKKLSDELQRQESLAYFQHCLEEQRSSKPNASEVDWLLQAFEQTYDKVFGPDSFSGRDKKQSEKNCQQLAGLLADHGYTALAKSK